MSSTAVSSPVSVRGFVLVPHSLSARAAKGSGELKLVWAGSVWFVSVAVAQYVCTVSGTCCGGDAATPSMKRNMSISTQT